MNTDYARYELRKLKATNSHQAKVYREIIEGLKKSVPIIRKFNLKVPNVRLTKAIEEVIGKDLSVSFSEGSIRIYNFNNRRFKFEDSYSNSWIYVSNEASFDLDLYEPTDNRKPVMKEQETINNINKEIERLEDNIKELEDESLAEKIFEEYLDIFKRINEFVKYPWCWRSIYKFRQY